MNTAPRHHVCRTARRALPALLALLAAAPAFAQSRPPDYSQFRIISERNIFNPRRYARSTPQTERRETRRATRVEYFALVGTMHYDQGPFAIFDGTYRKSARPGDTIAGYQVAEVGASKVKLVSGTNELTLAVGRQLRREDDGPWKETAVAERSSSSYASAPTSSYRSGSSSRYGGSPAPAPGTSAPATFAPAPPMPAPGEEPQVMMIDPGTGAVIGGPPPGEAAGATNGPAADSGSPADETLRRLMQRREQEMNR